MYASPAGAERPFDGQKNRGPLRGGWVKLAVVVGLSIGVASAGLRARRYRNRRAAIADVSTSLRDYVECLLGPPLAPGESARQRMRRIEAGLPEARRRAPGSGSGAPAEDAWPARCRGDVDRARTALAPLIGEAAPARLDALLARVREDPAPAETPDLIDDLLHAVPAAGVSVLARPYPPPTARLAPPAASPLPAAAVQPLPVPVRSSPDEIRGMDPATLRLSFVDTKSPAWVCSFSPLRGEPLRDARCGEVLRGAVSMPREATLHAPGYLRTAHGRFDRFELVRPQDHDERDEVTPLPTSIETVALYGDQLVWVSGHRWFGRTVSPGGTPLGPPVELGDVLGTSPELVACPTDSGLVVGLKTFDDALVGRSSWRAMAAREGGAWQRTPGRAVVDVAATFTCEGHAGTWTWWAGQVVTQVRCNADRCETYTSDRLSLSWDVGSSLYAADLGGRALLLGIGTTPGPLLGTSVSSVRMRLAPLSALTEAEDVVLFSDAGHEGAGISQVTVYVRAGIALVLMKGDEALPYRAIRVDALGEYAPISVVN